MSIDLALALFDGEGAAVRAYAAAKESSGGGAPWLHEVGFVEHHHGGRLALRGTFAGHYVDVDESDHVSQRGAGEGAVVGGLVGALLGPPGIALGLLAGGVIGSTSGAVSDTEAEPQALVDRLRLAVPPSSSAVALVGDSSRVQEMLDALGGSAQSVSRQTLSADAAAELEAALSTAPPAAPEP